MAWDGEDALGLEGFSAWAPPVAYDRRPPDAVYQPAARNLKQQMPLQEAARRSSGYQRDGGAYQPGSGASPAAQRSSIGKRAHVRNSATRQLVRRACVTLGRREAEAEMWADRLEAEWLEEPSQLRALNDDDWTRLEVPAGLRAELQRNMGLPRARPQRPSSAPADGRGRASASRLAARASRDSLDPRQRGSELEPLRRNLRMQVGPSWQAALLKSLRARSNVDANALQTALRSLGVVGTTLAQLRAAVRAAAPGGGEPDAESVIGVLHGPLRGNRAQSVRSVYDTLDVRGAGLVPLSVLRRRCIAVEHPSVKAGRLSAKEALQGLLRTWRNSAEVSVEEFLRGHGPLSAVCSGDDDGFTRLVCRLWGVPLNSRGAVRAGVLQQQEPVPMSQEHTFVDDAVWLQQAPAGQTDRVIRQSDRLEARMQDQGVSDQYGKRAEARPTGWLKADWNAEERARWHAQTPQKSNGARQRAFSAEGAQPQRASYPMDQPRQRLQSFENNFVDEAPLDVAGRFMDEVDDYFDDQAQNGSFVDDVQQRRQAQASLRRTPHAQALLERLRAGLQRRGGNAVQDLSQRLRVAGRGQGGRVTALELGASLRQAGVGLPHGDAVELARLADVDGSACANVEKFLNFLVTPLNARRATLVRDVFRRLDEDRDGLVSIQQVLKQFVPGRHPDVEAGNKNGREALMELQAAFSSMGNGGRLSAPDFLHYYESISAGISSDQYFAHVAQSVWGFDSGPDGNRARNIQRQREGNIRIFEAGLG